MTPEFNLSECFKLAQNFPHLKRSSTLWTTIVSASRYTTANQIPEDTDYDILAKSQIADLICSVQIQGENVTFLKINSSYLQFYRRKKVQPRLDDYTLNKVKDTKIRSIWRSPYRQVLLVLLWKKRKIYNRHLAEPNDMITFTPSCILFFIFSFYIKPNAQFRNSTFTFRVISHVKNFQFCIDTPESLRPYFIRICQ